MSQLNLCRKIAPISSALSPPTKKQALRFPDKVLIVGSQTGAFCIYTKKSRTPTESSFIQPALGLLASNDNLQAKLHINGIYTLADPKNCNIPLRYVTKKGSRPFDWQVFVRILNDPRQDTSEYHQQYGELITKRLNMVSEKHYTYKVSFVFAGDLTPTTGPLPLGLIITTSHVMNIITNSHVDVNLNIDKILDDEQLLKQYFGDTSVIQVRSFYPHYSVVRPYSGVSPDVTTLNDADEEDKSNVDNDADFHSLLDSYPPDFESNHHPE